MSRLTKVIATSRSVRFSVRRAGRESMYHPYAARRGDRRNWVATIGKTVLEPVRLLQSGIHWIVDSGLYRWPTLSDKVNEVGCKGFLCSKKQNVPAETGTHFSTRPTVSDSKLLSSKILKNRKLFC